MLVLSAATASAGTKWKSLGNGYSLAVKGTALYVVKAKREARVVDVALSIVDVKIDKAKGVVNVTVEDADTCRHDSTRTHALAFAHLDARIENAAGFVLYTKKRYRDAIVAYAKAVAADPSWLIPAINLASSQNLAGDPTAAVKTLAPWVARDPLGMYIRIAMDAEIASLLSRPELATLRAKTPGKVEAGRSYLIDRVVYAPERDVLAALDVDDNSTLVIHDATSGALVTSVPLIQKREAAAFAALGDLGFGKPAMESGRITGSPEEGKFKATFARAKLGVVISGGKARVLSNNTVLGTGNTNDIPSSADFLEKPRTMVLDTYIFNQSHCRPADMHEITVIPVRALVPPSTAPTTKP